MSPAPSFTSIHTYHGSCPYYHHLSSAYFQADSRRHPLLAHLHLSSLNLRNPPSSSPHYSTSATPPLPPPYFYFNHLAALSEATPRFHLAATFWAGFSHHPFYLWLRHFLGDWLVLPFLLSSCLVQSRVTLFHFYAFNHFFLHSAVPISVLTHPLPPRQFLCGRYLTISFYLIIKSNVIS